MKCSYKRKKIVMRPYGANLLQDIPQLPLESYIVVPTTKQNNEKILNAISEVGKGDCIIMGDFNHGNIKWDTLRSTGVEDQTFLCLVQDNLITQHVLEPTRAARILYIVLSSHKEFVDNVVIQEPLGSSDHNQLHFNIKIKSDKTKVKQCRRDYRKGNYKEIRKSLAHIDGNDKMKNKMATECWNILKGEIDSAIDSYVPMKKQGKRSKKKHLSKEAFRKIRHKQLYVEGLYTYGKGSILCGLQRGTKRSNKRS